MRNAQYRLSHRLHTVRSAVPHSASYHTTPGQSHRSSENRLSVCAAVLVLSGQVENDISTLVLEGVAFFTSIIVFYFFIGTAASFVEAQWGVITGSPGKTGSYLAGKIGQLALAVILALLAYPLVNWVAGVLFGSL